MWRRSARIPYRASKAEKGQILKEAGRATGNHRKSLGRLLRRPPAERGRQRRPWQYGLEVAWALKQAWETVDRPCSKRLAPFLPELVADLVSHCGASTEGFYLTMLTVVDVGSGWVEVEPVWGKGRQRVGCTAP